MRMFALRLFHPVGVTFSVSSIFWFSINHFLPFCYYSVLLLLLGYFITRIYSFIYFYLYFVYFYVFRYYSYCLIY